MSGGGGFVLPVNAGSADFIRDLTVMIGQPWGNHTLYSDPLLMPMHRTVAVYGRRGVGKRAAVEHYCEKNDITYDTVTIEYGQTATAVAALQASITKDFRDANPKFNTVDHVFIIERADILVFEPSNEETMLFSMTMEQMARRYNIMFVCLFDRHPAEFELGGNSMFRRTFFEQFPLFTYLSPPGQEYRLAFFKNYFKAAAEKFGFSVSLLSEGDYLLLADASRYTTPREQLAFVHSAVYTIAADTQQRAVVVDMNFLQRFMFRGGRSITRHDAKLVEQDFCRTCTLKMFEEATPAASAPAEAEPSAPKRAKTTTVDAEQAEAAAFCELMDINNN
jgi:hypothetical protein